jgi:hypothetical protein
MMKSDPMAMRLAAEAGLKQIEEQGIQRASLGMIGVALRHMA